MNDSFQGYRRENGRVGVRNHVIVLPVDDLSNAAAEAVANNIKGTLAIPHPYGRLQFGEDLELFFRTIIGTGANPNVAAAVVIGIDAGQERRPGRPRVRGDGGAKDLALALVEEALEVGQRALLQQRVEDAPVGAIPRDQDHS